MMGTEHYNLKQWERWEGPKRDEVNENFAMIDAELATRADTSAVDRNFLAHASRLHSLEERIQISFGMYTGDGAASQTITLRDTPQAVLVESSHGKRSGTSSGNYGGLATEDCPCQGSRVAIEIVENGFCVHQNSGYTETNQSGAVYCYLAFV